MNGLKTKAAMLRSLLVLAGLAAATFAHAEMLVTKNVMVSLPAIPKSETLEIASAGRLTVTVSDLAWPKVLQTLSFAIADATGVIRGLTGAGTLTYDLTGPRTLFADVYAAPNTSVGVGLYHIDVSFVSAVPLPFAGWLLLSGLVGIGTLWRKHVSVTNPVVQ